MPSRSSAAAKCHLVGPRNPLAVGRGAPVVRPLVAPAVLAGDAGATAAKATSAASEGAPRPQVVAGRPPRHPAAARSRPADAAANGPGPACVARLGVAGAVAVTGAEGSPVPVALHGPPPHRTDPARAGAVRVVAVLPEGAVDKGVAPAVYEEAEEDAVVVPEAAVATTAGDAVADRCTPARKGFARAARPDAGQVARQGPGGDVRHGVRRANGATTAR